MQVRIMFFNSPHMYVLENTSKPFGLRHTSNSPVALGPVVSRSKNVSTGAVIRAKPCTELGVHKLLAN